MDEPQWAGQTSPNQELELPTASTRTRSPTQAGQDMKLERDDTNIVVKHSMLQKKNIIIKNHQYSSMVILMLQKKIIRWCSPNPNPIRFKMVSWRDLGGKNVETQPISCEFHGNS